MSTQLKGDSTFFLPFNQDLENVNEDGFATSYLWEDVLRKDSLLDYLPLHKFYEERVLVKYLP